MEERQMNIYFAMVCRVSIILIICSLAHCDITKGDDDIYNLNGTTYKVMYNAKTWNASHDSCSANGAKLAVPKSEEEFMFLQKVVRGIHYPNIVGTDYKLLVWLGINNLANYHMWKTIDGENLDDVGFHTWAGQYNGMASSDDPAEPHCVGMDAVNFGLRDYWCHQQQPYICQYTTHNKHFF